MAIDYIDTLDTTARSLASSAEILIDTQGRLAITSVSTTALSATTAQFIDITVLGGVVASGRAIDLGSFDGTNSGTGEHTILIGADGFIYASLANQAAIELDGDQNQVTNWGQIISNDDAIEINNEALNGEVFIENRGLISANDIGFNIDFVIGNTASATAYVTNSGEITTQRSDGIQIVHGTLQLENSGSVYSFSGDGVQGSSGALSITNSGTITGQIGIAAFSGTLDLLNSGTITATGSANAAIQVTGADASSITNSGIVNGIVNLDSGDDQILNTGLINGDVFLQAGADVYDGYGGGVIEGTLDMGVGDDTIYVDQNDASIDGGGDTDVVYARSDVLDVTGVEQIILQGAGGHTVVASDGDEDIRGNIGNNRLEGGAGNDTIEGRAGDDVILGGANQDQLFGNTGNDFIEGGDGVDTLDGGAGNDTLDGGTGKDSLEGGNGNDELIGGAAEDTINGGDGADTLDGGSEGDDLEGGRGRDVLDGGTEDDRVFGGDGNDLLLGSAGDDTIRGDAGNDTIVGGAGVDDMIGKAGADVFVFDDVTHLGTGPSDRIRDFENGRDLIDVSGIDDSAAFTFIGTGAFSASGGMELRYTVNAAGTHFIYLDTDGDGVSDGRLVLLSTTDTLTADDFIL